MWHLQAALQACESVVVCVQHQNFEEQMQGMKTQLIQLSTLLRLLDLAFWNYLGMRWGSSSGSHPCVLNHHR